MRLLHAFCVIASAARIIEANDDFMLLRGKHKQANGSQSPRRATSGEPWCGDGTTGNGLCADASFCCSEHGFCGDTEQHCDASTCHSGPGCSRRGVPCGDGVVGTGVCEDPEYCCSDSGWCDYSEEHCNPNTCWSGPGCPTQDGVPCGDGVVGSGLCDDPSFCCSEFGYCDYTFEHCDTSSCYSSPDNSCTREAAVGRIPGYSSTSMPSVAPSSNISTSAISDDQAIASASLVIDIDPTIVDEVDELAMNSTDEETLNRLREKMINAWASPAGLELASQLDSDSSPPDMDLDAYYRLRELAEATNAILCESMASSPSALLSQEAIDCVCGTSGRPATYCAASVDRELLDYLNATSVRSSRDNRELGSCSINYPGKAVQDASELQELASLDTLLKQVTKGEQMCLAAQCSIPLTPKAPFIGLKMEAGGCVPGIDLQAMTICEDGQCKSIQEAFLDLADTHTINTITDPNIFLRGGICLIGHDKYPGMKDVLVALQFVGISPCIAELGLYFHPLMGFLSIEARLGVQKVAALGVGFEAQFYDDIKSATQVCGMLDGDQCGGQASKNRGQHSCSLCANEERGEIWAEVGLFFWSKRFSVGWGDNTKKECKTCQTRPPPCIDDAYFDRLTEATGSQFNSEIFLSQPPDPAAPLAPSTVYKFGDFMAALKKLSSSKDLDFSFWFGNDCSVESRKVALVNMAAFLGQAMRETIIYDACDENNWDLWRADIYKEPTSPPETLAALYPMSSGCGQLGQKYADYTCDDECPQDLSLDIVATTNAGWIGAPPPVFCGPKSKYDGLGYWNPQQFCEGPDNTCEGQSFYYEGQTAGVHVPVSDDSRFPELFYTNPLPDANGNTPFARSPDEFPRPMLKVAVGGGVV